MSNVITLSDTEQDMILLALDTRIRSLKENKDPPGCTGQIRVYEIGESCHIKDRLEALRPTIYGELPMEWQLRQRLDALEARVTEILQAIDGFRC